MIKSKKKKKVNKKGRKKFNIKKETTEYIVENPTLNGEKRRSIRVADWNRIKRKLKAISQGSWLDRIMKDAAIFFLGISITTSFGLFSFSKETFKYYNLYICIAIFSLAFSVILFLADWQRSKDKEGRSQEVEIDMEEIEETFGKEE